jgi:hypothetical protein
MVLIQLTIPRSGTGQYRPVSHREIRVRGQTQHAQGYPARPKRAYRLTARLGFDHGRTTPSVQLGPQQLVLSSQSNTLKATRHGKNEPTGSPRAWASIMAAARVQLGPQQLMLSS